MPLFKVPFLVLLLLAGFVSETAHAEPVPVVARAAHGQTLRARAAVVIPAQAQPIARYAADELAAHIAQATGVSLAIFEEGTVPDTWVHRIYIGSTQAAAKAGVHVETLPSEAFVLRSRDGNLFIAAQDGPGDPMSTTFSGSLFGVYEVLERGVGVRWLWPGTLGTYVPERNALAFGPYEETVPPRFVHRLLRPSISATNPPNGDLRLAFTPAERVQYAKDQAVFLRRHRMGSSANTYFTQRTSGSGHSFEGWWERYGKEHPDWFQLGPDGRRGPADPARPQKFTMCVSNPGLQAQIVALWKAERAQYPGEPINIGLAENDAAGACCCENCRAWDGPPPNLEGLPPGLERSYQPTQASNRYARFAKAVQALAAEADPEVKVHLYAFENYFWAPAPDITLNENIVIGFVPWFRWAGWFPRTDAEQAWLKEQWMGWQRSGASVYYRPNWFLDGWCMPHVYPHQFADAFQYYASHDMIGADFDSLVGQWAAQGPNLYLLARIHVRPEEKADRLLNEFYDAFGPAKKSVRAYFEYWERYSFRNRERAANAIRTRRDGAFRRYALYAQVADELYPLEVFAPAQKLLDRAKMEASRSTNRAYGERVAFLQEGFDHARLAVETAKIMNSPASRPAERAAALDRLIAFRRSIAPHEIANLDRLSVIELESWKSVPGFLPAKP